MQGEMRSTHFHPLLVPQYELCWAKKVPQGFPGGLPGGGWSRLGRRGKPGQETGNARVYFLFLPRGLVSGFWAPGSTKRGLLPYRVT